jgi:hypothetical protein
MSENKDTLINELAAFIQGHLDRVTANLTRVDLLVHLAEETLPPTLSAVHKQDLLRAAVVFLHATLEDFLRYVASPYLPQGSEDSLNDIPLVGIRDRPENKWARGLLYWPRLWGDSRTACATAFGRASRFRS